MSDNGQWVSISEAADALGISERQARRYAGRLDAHDRRQAGHEAGLGAGLGAGRASGVTVKLTAMRAARELATGEAENKHETAIKDAASTCGPDVPTDTRPDVRPDAETVGAGHEAGRQAGHGPDAVLIDELRDQVKYLRSALEARDRDAAEMRATMRALVAVMPKVLPSGAGIQADKSDRQVLAEVSQNEMQGTGGPLDTMATKETRDGPSERNSQRVARTAWQRIAARILRIR
jgi:hypothetical protein